MFNLFPSTSKELKIKKKLESQILDFFCLKKQKQKAAAIGKDNSHKIRGCIYINRGKLNYYYCSNKKLQNTETNKRTIQKSQSEI